MGALGYTGKGLWRTSRAHRQGRDGCSGSSLSAESVARRRNEWLLAGHGREKRDLVLQCSPATGERRHSRDQGILDVFSETFSLIGSLGLLNGKKEAHGMA